MGKYQNDSPAINPYGGSKDSANKFYSSPPRPFFYMGPEHTYEQKYQNGNNSHPYSFSLGMQKRIDMPYSESHERKEYRRY